MLRTTSVSPLDRDKDTLSLTRKNADAFFRLQGVEVCWALSEMLGVPEGGLCFAAGKYVYEGDVFF